MFAQYNMKKFLWKEISFSYQPTLTNPEKLQERTIFFCPALLEHWDRIPILLLSDIEFFFLFFFLQLLNILACNSDNY